MGYTTVLQKLLSLLLLYYGLFGMEAHANAKNDFKMLQFDDVLLTDGLGKLPNSYHHLNFSGFNVFEPRNPALSEIISPHDINCAVSLPNALVGSRYTPDNSSDYVVTSITIDSKSAELAGLKPYFDLLTLWIKPLDGPEPGSSVYLKGTSADGPNNGTYEYEWHVNFPHGYYEPLLVKIEDYAGEKWAKLEKVELWADFGYSALDWEFCIDDVEVGFYELEEDSFRQALSAHEL